MISLHFNKLSRFVIAFLSISKFPLNVWLQSPSAVILEPKKRKSVTTFTFSLLCHGVMGLDAWILAFNAEFQASFFTPSWPSSRGSLFPLHCLPLVISSAYLRLLIIVRQSWFQLVIDPTVPQPYFWLIQYYSLPIIIDNNWFVNYNSGFWNKWRCLKLDHLPPPWRYWFSMDEMKTMVCIF